MARWSRISRKFDLICSLAANMAQSAVVLGFAIARCGAGASSENRIIERVLLQLVFYSLTSKWMSSRWGLIFSGKWIFFLENSLFAIVRSEISIQSNPDEKLKASANEAVNENTEFFFFLGQVGNCFMFKVKSIIPITVSSHSLLQQ